MILDIKRALTASNAPYPRFYGPQLGVRTPPESAPEQYTDAKRLEEFRTARGRGLVAGGIIAFHNNR